jgi:glycosyltransferase involved in cell wall biosynthesis
MLNNKTIAVIVPAYNEEKQIGRVIETMPDFVDRIIVVNDNSTDNTAEVVKELIRDKKISHSKVKIASNLNSIEQNEYNYADMVVQEHNRKEIMYFPPSEVHNKDVDNDKIILISKKK